MDQIMFAVINLFSTLPPLPTQQTLPRSFGGITLPKGRHQDNGQPTSANNIIEIKNENNGFVLFSDLNGCENGQLE
jgi:hypothetical protein